MCLCVYVYCWGWGIAAEKRRRETPKQKKGGGEADKTIMRQPNKLHSDSQKGRRAELPSRGTGKENGGGRGVEGRKGKRGPLLTETG